MKQKCLIVHHTDNDGCGAAGVISYFFKNSHDITFKPANYSEPLFSKKDISKIANNYDKIFLVDYSISTKENADTVLELNDNTNVTWIDHHKSSIDMMNEYPRLANIDGYRIIGLSGAALSWLYICKLNIGGLLVSSDIMRLDAINNSYHCVEPDQAIILLKRSLCPETIRYIHRYDIWDLDQNVKYFNYGYELTDPKKLYPSMYHKGIDKDTVDNAIHKGRIISEYETQENARSCSNNAFEISIEYRGNIYKCLALNTSKCSSLTFEDNMSNYDICMPFYYTGDKWYHSMYTEKEGIDVSALCKAMGGGGHPQAAGYVSDELDILDKKLIIK